MAGILALLDMSESPDCQVDAITARQLLRAAGLWSDYFWPHAREALRAGGRSPQRRLDRRAARWLQQSGQDLVSREDIRRYGLSEAVDAGGADKVIRRLEAAGPGRG
jgi:hypothetical protein